MSTTEADTKTDDVLAMFKEIQKDIYTFKRLVWDLDTKVNGTVSSISLNIRDIHDYLKKLLAMSEKYMNCELEKGQENRKNLQGINDGYLL